MKYYINANSKIYAFEDDGSQDHLITSDMTPLTQQEVIDRTTPSDAEQLQAWRESATVSKFQAKAALKQAGLLGQVKTSMQSLPEDDFIRIAWEDATEFRRLSPTVLTLATDLGLTDAQLDDLFEQAKTIEA